MMAAATSRARPVASDEDTLSSAAAAAPAAADDSVASSLATGRARDVAAAIIPALSSVLVAATARIHGPRSARVSSAATPGLARLGLGPLTDPRSAKSLSAGSRGSASLCSSPVPASREGAPTPSPPPFAMSASLTPLTPATPLVVPGPTADGDDDDASDACRNLCDCALSCLSLIHI